MKKPDILMFHRVRIGNTQQVNNWYFQRKMIVDIDRVFKIIDDYFVNGYLAGSIQQCIEKKRSFSGYRNPQKSYHSGKNQKMNII